MPSIVQLRYILGSGESRGELLNPLQLVQGTVIGLGCIWLLYKNIKISSTFRKALIPMIGFIVVNVCVVAAAYLGDHFHKSYDFTSAIKIFYWCFVWLLTIMYVHDVKSCNKIQAAFVYGAVFNTLFIVYFFFTGQTRVDPYLRAGVEASFGAGGVSGKGMIGFMLYGIFIAPVTPFFRSKWIGSGLSAIILVGLALTNDRTGQLAFVLGLGWMSFWLLGSSSRSTQRSGYVRMIFASLIAGAAYFSTLSLDNLIKRWSDVGGENAGSGRLRMWQGAMNHFWSSDYDLMFLGGGHTNVRDAMLSQLNANVHTHSDLFDQLLGVGLVGMVVYCLFFVTIFRLALGVNRRSIHFALAITICIMMISMSVLTSQLLYPHSMITGLILLTLQIKLGRTESHIR